MSYTVTAIAKNDYSRIEETFTLEITGLDCSQPQVKPALFVCLLLNVPATG